MCSHEATESLKDQVLSLIKNIPDMIGWDSIWMLCSCSKSPKDATEFIVDRCPQAAAKFAVSSFGLDGEKVSYFIVTCTGDHWLVTHLFSSISFQLRRSEQLVTKSPCSQIFVCYGIGKLSLYFMLWLSLSVDSSSWLLWWSINTNDFCFDSFRPVCFGDVLNTISSQTIHL